MTRIRPTRLDIAKTYRPVIVLPRRPRPIRWLWERRPRPNRYDLATYTLALVASSAVGIAIGSLGS